MNNYIIFIIVGFISSSFIVAMKICFASKCDEIKFCYGAVEIHRSISQEAKEIEHIPNRHLPITQMSSSV